MMKRSYFIFLLAFISMSCVGKKLTNQQPSEVIVPDELAKSFEVKEYYPGEIKKDSKPVDDHLKDSVAGKSSKLDMKKESKNVKNKSETKNKAEPVAVNIFQNRRPKIDPIWVGEKIFMDVSWLKTRAGEFELTVQPFKVVNDRKVYHFKGFARTADFFAWFYKADDYAESFVDYEYWVPYKFTLKGDESKYKRNYLELYDHQKSKQYVHTVNFKIKTSETAEEKGYKDLIPMTQDAISSLYFARTFTLNDGVSVKFPMTTNGRQVEAELKVVGREELNTKAGTFKAIKTQVFTKLNGNLQQKGDSFIWFTDDERKYPIKFEAKVKIGWVTGLVKKIEPGTPAEQTSNAEINKFSREVATAEAGVESKTKTKDQKAWFYNMVDKEDKE